MSNYHQQPKTPEHRNRSTQPDVRRLIGNATYQFRQKTEDLVRSTKKVTPDTLLYQLQVDFSYLLHELQNGYIYRRRNVYTQIMDFVNSIPEKVEV